MQIDRFGLMKSWIALFHQIGKNKKKMNEVGIWFEKTQVQDSATRGLTSLCKFKNQLYKKYIDRSSRVDNFTISRNF